MMASAVLYSENILRSIIKWAGAQKGVPTPYPHERIQSHRDSPALLFTTHPWRVSSCCLCEQHGSFINRGVEGCARRSLTSCPGPPFAPPQSAPRSVLDQKKTVARLPTQNTHTSLWERFVLHPDTRRVVGQLSLVPGTLRGSFFFDSGPRGRTKQENTGHGTPAYPISFFHGVLRASRARRPGSKY